MLSPSFVASRALSTSGYLNKYIQRFKVAHNGITAVYHQLKQRLDLKHIKPYHKVIYDHLQWSIATLWRTVPSWEHKPIAVITTRFEQRKGHEHRDTPSKNTINTQFKRGETHWVVTCVCSCSDTTDECKQKHMTWKQLFQRLTETNKQLFSIRTSANTTDHSVSLLKWAFILFLDGLLQCPCPSTCLMC